MSDNFDDPDAEVHISITPRDEDLERLGIDADTFEDHLSKALDEYLDAAERDPATIGETPPIEEMPVTIDGRTFRLSELADIEISDPTFDEESE